MMKLVSHAPVDAAADQVECVAGIVTLTNDTTYVSLRKIYFILIVEGSTLPLLSKSARLFMFFSGFAHEVAREYEAAKGM